MAIRIEHITKSYGNQQAVDDVSFTIPVGQTCGFLGPNGAGKSTLMKIMTGYLKPDHGSVWIDDINVADQPILSKQKIGYLPEHNSLYYDQYVREFLQFCCGVFHIQNAKLRIEEVIEQTGLTKEAHKRIGQLSKGYKQRVGLAHALIHDPSVLILDEPLNGLDPNQLAEIRELIIDLAKEKTVLFSSHILQEVELVAQRIILIQDGKIVHDETNESLKKESNFIRVVCADQPSDSFVQSISSLGETYKNGNEVIVDASGDSIRQQIFEQAVKHQQVLLILEEESISLTDIFKEKTK